MNREIKFRAWDGKQMHYLDYLWNNYWYSSPKEDGRASMDNANIPCDREYQSGRLKLMQYTGLKDKNGKEIYEGDLIAEIDHISELESWGKPAVVEWGQFETDKDSWELKSATTGFLIRYSDGSINGLHSHESAYGFRDIEIMVLGNLYENPELIK